MDETTNKRPDLGELTVGQDVIIVRSYNDRRERRPEENYIPAKIVKAARVWITMTRPGQEWPVWKMRRDTQDEATQYSGNNARFVTLEQHAWEETQRWAKQVLRENGIELDLSSPWRKRKVELADLITGGRKA